MGALAAAIAGLGKPETPGGMLAAIRGVAADAMRHRSRVLDADLARMQDPALIFTDAGLDPDPWQREYLRSTASQNLVLCSRQIGKSTTAAGRAWHKARYTPKSLSLIVTPSLRQSQEVFRKVGDLRAASSGVESMESERESALQLELANGSRIVALPGKDKTIVGYSGVSLLILDEASRIPDIVYRAVRPMLSISRGTLDVLSTPLGQRGFFFQEWDAEDKRRAAGKVAQWRRWCVTADECPRHSPDFLATERESLGEEWFLQEYYCKFLDVLGAAFPAEAVLDAFRTELAGLALDGMPVEDVASMVEQELRALAL